MNARRRELVIRGRTTIGASTAVGLALVAAGAVLFVATKDRPRDFTGFPALLVPLLGATALTRGNLAAGLGAAALSLGLGYLMGVAVTVLTALAALARML